MENLPRELLIEIIAYGGSYCKECTCSSCLERDGRIRCHTCSRLHGRTFVMDECEFCNKKRACSYGCMVQCPCGKATCLVCVSECDYCYSGVCPDHKKFMPNGKLKCPTCVEDDIYTSSDSESD